MNEEQQVVPEESNEELYERRSFHVDKGQEPMRIDKWLQQRIENASRNKIQQGIEAGFLTVNGHTVKSNYKIRPGDEIILLSLTNPELTEVKPEPVPLDIVYEDEAILILNKTPNMVVHPGVGNYKGTLLNGIAYHLLQQNPQLTEDILPRYGLVHRIDKNTTGLLVVAKTSEVAAAIAKQFFNHSVARKYVALVWGDMEQDEGTIAAHIGRHRRFRKI